MTTPPNQFFLRFVIPLFFTTLVLKYLTSE
jgi:hypothetical protein